MMLHTMISKYKTLSLPVKAGLWFTICNVLQRGISIITSPIFTRILTTEEYGTYSIYLSWLNILSIFTSLNLYYGVFNKAMVKYSDDADRYIASMQGLVIVLCSVFSLIYTFFHNQLNSLMGLSTTIVLMMIVEMIFTPMYQFWMGKKRFEYKYRGIVSISLAKSIVNPVLGILFVLICRNGAEARIFGTVLVEVAVCGTIMIYQFVKGRAFCVKKYWKYAIGFNIPLIPHYLSGSILNQGDRIVIQRICGASDVALYSVGYSVSMLSQLVTNAISQAITPWLYDCLKTKHYNEINNKLKPIMILVAVVCIILMLFAPEIVWIFASESYRDSVYIIPPVAASVFFIYMYNVYSNFEFYYEKRIFITIASLSAAVLNLILNFIFVPMFGYVAAGYTTLICYVVYAIAHYFFSYYICKKQLGGISIFDFRSFGLTSILLILASVGISLLYRNNIVRYVIIIIVLTVIVFARKQIILLIKNIRK